VRALVGVEQAFECMTVISMLRDKSFAVTMLSLTWNLMCEARNHGTVSDHRENHNERQKSEEQREEQTCDNE
jgi:hypothetical protein